MKFAVIVFPGSNCDIDMYHAIKDEFGEEVEYVWHDQKVLKDLMVFYSQVDFLMEIIYVPVQLPVSAIS